MLLDVPLNIYAISVRAHTQLVGVIFIAKVDPLQPDPCLLSPNLKNINLPTPCQGLFFALQMVPQSYELYILISFSWPLGIAVLNLPVITVIAFVLVLWMPECLIHRLGL